MINWTIIIHQLDNYHLSYRSPIRRRSLSGSSTSSSYMSPLILPSEDQTVLPIATLEPASEPPRFTRAGVHRAPVDEEDIWDIKRSGVKRQKEDVSDKRSNQKRPKQ